MVKDLTAIQPPCAFPLLSVLAHFNSQIAEEYQILSTSGQDQETFRMECEVYRCCMLILTGFSAPGRANILCEGSDSRFLAMMLLLSMAKSLSQAKDARRKWKNAPPSQFFSRLPSIPSPTRELGVTMTKQALQELKCAYGDDARQTMMYQILLATVSGWIRVRSVNYYIDGEVRPVSDSVDALWVE